MTNRFYKTLTALILTSLLAACNLTVTNEGGGVVISADEKINCGEICSAEYGTEIVILTATPIEGYRFIGWEGACEGSQNTCEITMGNSNVSVTAHFSDTVEVLSAASSMYQTCIEHTTGISCWDYSSDPLISAPETAKIATSLTSDGAQICMLAEQAPICFGGAEQRVFNETVLAEHFANVTLFDPVKPAGVIDGQFTFIEDQNPSLNYPFDSRITSEMWERYFSSLSHLENITQMAFSVNAICLIDSNEVHCDGQYFPLGVERVDENALPFPTIPLASNPRKIVSGPQHMCMLDDNGVQCWGDNSSGQTEVPEMPGNIVDLVNIKGLNCAKSDIDGYHCWGSWIYDYFTHNGKRIVIDPSILESDRIIASNYNSEPIAIKGKEVLYELWHWLPFDMPGYPADDEGNYLVYFNRSSPLTLTEVTNQLVTEVIETQ
ncbi:MAG: hypothetical protein MI867_02175 [Pseudomonadales bacterium]|nr:hypothetical protein [Pseudomonadales bacterium]